MILLEEDTLQRPKLRTDPSDWAPSRANAVALASGRSPSPNTTLPDYEASQAQHPSPHKRPFYRRIWHTKAGKVISYAFAIYSAIFVVIGIPAFVLSRGYFTGNPTQRLLWPGDGIILRTNSSSNNLTDYVSGSLRVDMNPDKNVSGIVLVANTLEFQLSTLTGELCMPHKLYKHYGVDPARIYPDREESHLDTIDMDLQLLLPWTPAPINFKMFATHLPMFSQSFGDLRHVAFRRFELAGSNSTVAVASVRASSIVVQTSSAEISGNFSASENILLDTINGPIVAQVNLQVDERRYFSTPPKHPNFMTMFKTFNAPMNVSIAHVAGSEPARFGVVAENTQGAMTMTLDSVYTGLFELRTKAATALVQETPAATDAPLDEENELHFEKHVTSEWTHGWIGDSDPEKSHHHEANRVKLLNSLAPIELRLARLRPSTAVRR
ncbi:hypothetical protein EDB85DRAFT_1886789 [Lactarius pseudohatsudake]|nr:hypothetical protein EDB85DRAFT_1886789 [Lactarius pseudohatsudake]